MMHTKSLPVWYIPSWSGDFRVEADPDDHDQSRLTVVDPTPAERAILARFEKTCVKKGWTEVSGLADRASTPLVAPVADVAGALAALIGQKRAGVITAVVSEKGKTTVTEVLGADDLPKWVTKESAKLAAAGAAPVAAVTVKRPSLSCPECEGRPVKDRAPCDVLWAFLDPAQQREWLARRAVTVFGGLTGHAYRVHARDTEQAARIGRTTIDLDDRVTLHNYAWDVPAEEEVLVVKLLLEHRENWLRVYGEVDPFDRARQVFTNPLPGGPYGLAF